MKIKFWGTIGSIPRPLISTDINNKLKDILKKYDKLGNKEKFIKSLRKTTYGGNTPCVEVRAKGELIILDAGSGIRELGLELLKEEFRYGKGKATILFTHTHFDHIEGWLFFTPAYISGNSFTIYGPAQHVELGILHLREIFEEQMTHSFFPVPLRYLRTITFYDIGRTTFNIGNLKVYTHPLQHTCDVLGYKIVEDDKILVYATDNEIMYNPYPEGYPDEAAKEMLEQKRKDIKEFMRDADIFICDAQYTPEEYKEKRGWGHNSYEAAVDMAKYANVKTLVLFHHDPQHTDEQIDNILRLSKKYAKKINFTGRIIAAYDGLEITL